MTDIVRHVVADGAGLVAGALMGLLVVNVAVDFDGRRPRDPLPLSHHSTICVATGRSVGRSSCMNLDDAPSALNVVPISASPDDRWRLTDPYVEDVWSEFLGPTATLMARRLGRLIEVRPGGAELDLRDFATSLGVAPSVAVRALERLHRFEVIHSDLERGLVGVSGYAPAVGEGRVIRLSEAGRVAHERFTAGASVEHPAPGRASRILAPVASPSLDRGLLPIARS